MPMEEFYHTNPKEMERHMPFLIERYKQGKNGMSEVGWMNGHYVARAISACLSKNKSYPDEYIEFYPTEPEEEFTDADRFWAFAQMFNVGAEKKEDVVIEEAGEAIPETIDTTNLDS